MICENVLVDLMLILLLQTKHVVVVSVFFSAIAFSLIFQDVVVWMVHYMLIAMVAELVVVLLVCDVLTFERFLDMVLMVHYMLMVELVECHYLWLWFVLMVELVEDFVVVTE